MFITFHNVHDIWLQMTIKYKELELLAKSETTKWVKEGASNLFAVARGNGSVFWIVRAAYQRRRSVITLGRWPAMKAETARELAPSVKILIRQGFSDVATNNRKRFIKMMTLNIFLIITCLPLIPLSGG